jgi:hypothetical protein
MADVILSMSSAAYSNGSSPGCHRLRDTRPSTGEATNGQWNRRSREAREEPPDRGRGDRGPRAYNVLASRLRNAGTETKETAQRGGSNGRND